jgi:hypothetical protein
MTHKRETTEQMLSRMALSREQWEATNRGMSLEELRKFRRACNHTWGGKSESGLVDICIKCGECRA